MLAYILALAVGLGSLAIYIAAFFFPEVHRKNDFIWSGVGLFYALVLWACAGRITGSLLLGQVAGVALLGWSVGQTLSLRRQLTPRSQTQLPSTAEVKNKVQEKLSKLSFFDKISQMGKQVGGSATAAKERLQENLSGTTRSPSPTEDKPRVEIIDNRTPIPQPADIPATESATDVAEVTQANPPAASREDVVDLGGVSPIPANKLDLDAEIEPTLTEEEAIALAVETTLAEADQEDIVSEPMRPHPPDPEIVEAAIRDAEEKHIEASPPEPETPENPLPS